MGLYRRGRTWWVRIQWQGRLVRQSTGATGKELARRIEHEIRSELASGKWFEKDPAESVLFSEAWERYLKEDAKFKSPGTYQRAKQAGKNFLPVIGGLNLSEVKPPILGSYKAKRLEQGVKAATVVKELHFIRRVFSLCKREWQLVKQSPFEFFRMPSVNDQRVRFLEPGQLETLLAHCPAWLRPMVMLARYTGMRRGNILGLTWSSVDFQNRVVHLEHTKGGQRLTIPLNDAAHDTLLRLRDAKVKHLHCPYVFHQDGKPYAPYWVSIAFRRSCKRANIENFRFHDLRHDFASSLVQNGNDLYVVQHLLGHKDGRMTQRYAHLRLENLRTAVMTIDWAEGGHKNGHSGSEKELALSATS